MKRILSIILMVWLTFSLAACGGETEPLRERESLRESDTTQPNVVGASAQGENISVSEPVSALVPEAGNAGLVESAGNILVVYFSRWGNTDYPDDVDASTSASIVLDSDARYGTTEYVANMIANEVGADLHRIETVTSYTADFDELRNVNHDEMNKNYLPELKTSNLDITQYDTVFVGYPVWATDVPQAVISFLKEYDLAGKTVIPFCTHDGYGAGRSYQTIAEASHAGTTLDGIAIEAKDVPGARDTVAGWLADIGISGAKVQAETAVHITIADITLEGVLYNTALAEEIKAYFPLTISMVGYGGREYYGGVSFYPENLEGGQRNFKNGDITYCEAHHNMAIFYAQTDNPNLSVDVIPIGRVTSDLSVFESLGSREEITFSLADKESQQGEVAAPGNGNGQQNDTGVPGDGNGQQNDMTAPGDGSGQQNDITALGIGDAGAEDTTDGVKVLVAYFSATNTTKGVAENLADGLGADLYQIVPETPYTTADLNYNSNSSRTTIEMNDPNARPAISGSVENMEQYDVIFLGYPIWWAEAPRIINTFVESYDFSGKTIVPFCTSGGSGMGSSARNLHSATNGAAWLDGRKFSGSASADELVEWADGLGLDLSATQ